VSYKEAMSNVSSSFYPSYSLPAAAQAPDAPLGRRLPASRHDVRLAPVARTRGQANAQGDRQPPLLSNPH